MSNRNFHQGAVLALCLSAPLLSGCGGASMGDVFSSDLLSKDADWFSRPGRVFIKSVAIDAPPLTPNKAVTADELISADGACPGMTPPDAANAMADGTASQPVVNTGSVALGHTECDVTRGIGAPDSVNFSANERGDRVAVLTWGRGPRAGIYTFTAGRLSSIDRVPQAEPPPRPAKGAKPAKKRAAG